MTKDEALKLALEALEYASTGNRRPEIIGPAISAIKEALQIASIIACRDALDAQPVPHMSKLTRDQAAIIGLYTGVSMGPFEDVQKLAEDLLERPVFTHELANQNLCEKLKELVKPQFIQICAEKNT